MRPPLSRYAAAAVSLVLAACQWNGADQPVAPDAEILPNAFAADRSSWSEPVHLGPLVNSPARDLGARLSPDGLSLYLHSDRDGDMDIWVSRRACRDCAWGPAVNLGPPINTEHADADAELSSDGHFLFFASDRPGGNGRTDIYVAHRVDPKDDFGWGDPIHLGPLVNTDAQEGPSDYLRAGGEGGATLFFNRGIPPESDFYRVSIAHDGRVLGPPTLIGELSLPGISEGYASLRGDGREVVFWSDRPGGLGGADIWSATRRSVNDPWQTPLNLGAPVNTPFAEFTVTLSDDGRTLLFSGAFARDPEVGLGRQDIWMSTRAASGR